MFRKKSDTQSAEKSVQDALNKRGQIFAELAIAFNSGVYIAANAVGKNASKVVATYTAVPLICGAVDIAMMAMNRSDIQILPGKWQTRICHLLALDLYLTGVVVGITYNRPDTAILGAIGAASELCMWAIDPAKAVSYLEEKLMNGLDTFFSGKRPEKNEMTRLAEGHGYRK